MGPGSVQMRIRFIRTALTLLLATTGFSQIVASQEASDAAIGQHSEDGSTNICRGQHGAVTQRYQTNPEPKFEQPGANVPA
jgi:hypothetical protein